MKQLPNIIVFISHDTGRHISPYGISTVRTPNAEKFATDGVLFTQAYCTAPQCSPSRASLYTGRYPHANGMLGLASKWAGWKLHDQEIHLAEHLGSMGYETGLFGNAHEGIGHEADPDGIQRLGFDYSRHHAEFPALDAANELEMWLKGRKNTKRPFYAQIAVEETHVPYGEEIDDTLGVTIPAHLNDLPGTRQNFANLQASIKRLDDGLGQLVDLLERMELTEHTWMIVTTDHGLAVPRAKGSLYDPGIEIMLMMRYPKMIPSNMRYDNLVSNVDILPTLLEGLGAEEDQGQLQGVSFWSLLTGGDYKEREAIYAEKTFHESYTPYRGVRTSSYKYIRNFEPVMGEFVTPEIMGSAVHIENSELLFFRNKKAAPPEELYDLAVDPLERNNLAADPGYATTVKRLCGMLARWMKETADPLLEGPIASPKFRENIAELKQYL